MSMHKIPLTDIEREGLKAHGLDIGTPSQLSDCFRHGMKWAQEQAAPVQAQLVTLPAQESLGAEFEKVLFDNLDSLYEEGDTKAPVQARDKKSFAKLYADAAQGIEIERLKMALEKAQEQRKPSPIHQEWLEERAHRRCRRYIMIDTEAPYQFDVHTLMDLVRDIEAKLKEQP